MSLVVPVSTLIGRVGIKSKSRAAWAETGVVRRGLWGEAAWASETGRGRGGVCRDFLGSMPSRETLLGGAKHGSGLRFGVREVVALEGGVSGRPNEVKAGEGSSVGIKCRRRESSRFTVRGFLIGVETPAPSWLTAANRFDPATAFPCSALLSGRFAVLCSTSRPRAGCFSTERSDEARTGAGGSGLSLGGVARCGGSS